MSIKDKIFAKHPITGLVAEVRPLEAALFKMEILPTNERTGKPVINRVVDEPVVSEPDVEEDDVTPEEEEDN